MRRTAQLLIAATVLAAVVSACRRDAGQSDDTDATAHAASQAMAALNRANDELADWYPASTTELLHLILTSPAAASRQMDADLLPKLDAYLAVADDAVTKAAAYQARLKDPDVQTSLDTIRRRTAAIHDLRRTLATVRDELARDDLTPADLERIGSTLSAAGTRVLLAN